MHRLFAVSLVVTALVTAAAAQEPPAIAKHTRWVTDLAFNGDGTVLATVGGESLQYRPGDVKLWDPKTGALTASLEGGHDTNVWSAALSADGKTLITAGYNGKVIVWDVAEKKARATLDRHKKWCRAVAISPDGSKFATGGEDEEVVIWETAGSKEIKALKAHEKATVYGLAFAPTTTRWPPVRPTSSPRSGTSTRAWRRPRWSMAMPCGPSPGRRTAICWRPAAPTAR
jgi:WD40 repeat protein